LKSIGAWPTEGHVDDPRWGPCLEQWEQDARQEERGQVVDREAQLVAVATQFTELVPARSRADARIVDEDVEAVVLREDATRKVPHLVERREVGPIVGKPVVAGCLADLGEGRVAASLVAPM
jgi:hypothetical protein